MHTANLPFKIGNNYLLLINNGYVSLNTPFYKHYQMKTVLTIVLAICAFIANAQNQSTEKQTKPDYFIDSVKVTNGDTYLLNFINPNDIASINVNKDKQYPNGAIFIKLKDHNILTKILEDKPLSIKDIWKANIPEAEKRRTVLYMLDDKLLTDTAAVRIPSMFVKKVTVVKASEMPYFKTALPNVLLMRISTKPEQIMIRGNDGK